ncbi:hypothetical protein KKG46_01195, partial [Patescibacteria group bacterium]|nr:hypothetical protein [Patescibacteria group bacterium]
KPTRFEIAFLAVGALLVLAAGSVVAYSFYKGDPGEATPAASDSAVVPVESAPVVEPPNAQPPVTAPAETAKPEPEAKVEKKQIACFPANATNLRRYLYQIDPEHFLYQIDPFSRYKLSLSCGDGQVQATANPDGTHDVSSCDICLPEGYEPDTWVDLSPEVLRAFTAQSGDPAHYVEPLPLKGHLYGEDVMRFGQFADGYPRVWGVSRSRDLTTGKLHLPPVEGEVTYY